jgi:hypothetical protein
MEKDDCYAYVRRYYGVPAFVGQRVRVRGVDGVLVNRRTSNQYVYILFDGSARSSGPFHPTDEIEYAPQASAQA